MENLFNEKEWQMYTAPTQEIWNKNASFWDDYMGEGNHFQKVLIAPVTEQLLNIQPGDTVLDVACGNGNFSRRLAQLGANVVAIDFSEIFVQRAKNRTKDLAEELADKIEFQVIDASKREQLLSLGEDRFDAAVCTMALMDMAEIKPLLHSLIRLLKPGGGFVFSITHPCFNSVGITKLIEQNDFDGNLVTEHNLKTSAYIKPVAFKGVGVVGQPEPQYYFHRPISMLLNHCFDAGFVLDRMEEPVFGKKDEHHRKFSWVYFKKFPPVMIARLRNPL